MEEWWAKFAEKATLFPNSELLLQIAQVIVQAGNKTGFEESGKVYLGAGKDYLIGSDSIPVTPLIR